jgi:hypothetical protein
MQNILYLLYYIANLFSILSEHEEYRMRGYAPREIKKSKTAKKWARTGVYRPFLFSYYINMILTVNWGI